MKSNVTHTEICNVVHLRAIASSALLVSYFAGIWAGLWDANGDIVPEWDRIEYAVIITALPFLLPFILKMVSILLIKEQRHNWTGSILLVLSLILAFLVGVFVVPMGSF